MDYYSEITLKDGRKCVLRSGTAKDGQASLDVFRSTHAETDFLLSYPEEITFTAEEQSEYLRKKHESENEAELVAARLDAARCGTWEQMEGGDPTQIADPDDEGFRPGF